MKREDLYSRVALAMCLLWGSLIFSGSAFWLDFKLNYRPLTFATIAASVSVLAIYVLLTIKIFDGRNWARIAYLILTIVGLPLNLTIILSDFNSEPMLST